GSMGRVGDGGGGSRSASKPCFPIKVLCPQRGARLSNSIKMISGIQFKVCGLNRVEDAVVAAEAGADYLGFIFYQKSPRNIDLESFRRIASSLPSVPKVAV